MSFSQPLAPAIQPAQGPEPGFDLLGRPSLDLANTLGRRGRETPREDLPTYAHLVAWAGQGGLIVDAEAEQLLETAIARPDEASSVHARAIAVREAIYRVVAACVHGQAPVPDDLATLNDELVDDMSHIRLVKEGDGLAWAWEDGVLPLDRVLWPVGRDAAELLTSEQMERVRVCADERCGWLFLDTTKNRSRQWCEMQTCGNRAKARRHYQRSKRG